MVCADGGVVHCLAAGIIPDFLVGDFDSVDPEILDRSELASVQRESYPSEKNQSDLELCLDLLCQLETVPDDVILLGVSGGRSDHHLFNWLLPMLRDWPFGVRLIDDSVDACLVSASRPFKRSCEVGRTLSLVALSEASGVTTAGLEYPLCDAVLHPGSTCGLSNVISDKEVCVSLSNGQLLAMQIRNTPTGTRL